jgi:hypothetical protein
MRFAGRRLRSADRSPRSADRTSRDAAEMAEVGIQAGPPAEVAWACHDVLCERFRRDADLACLSAAG